MKTKKSINIVIVIVFSLLVIFTFVSRTIYNRNLPRVTAAKVTSGFIPLEIETVASLYKNVRPEADYLRSLRVLSTVKQLDKNIHTKSGLMLGLGEAYDEVIRTFDDLLDAGCEFLTIGQYLSPSKKHYPVFEYIEPEVFTSYGKIAKDKGFRYVVSAPFVRSSYNAEKALEM